MFERFFTKLAFVLFVITLFASEANGQYFGRNKPRYRPIDFKVLESPNFEIYHYLNDSTAHRLADLSERWYSIHQGTFGDTIKYKNPIIFYETHGEFQQTTAVSGIIGIGTGGVTESFKNRVVMPIMETWAQTDHVLGHELVHAFQYNHLKASDSLSLNNIRNLPLWIVEGLAEYLSIGRVDAHTAMWMRDAVLQDDIPSLKDLKTKPNKYFPYRYGQAFWAFVGGVWGDSTVIELYKNVASYGLKTAIDSTLKINEENFSSMWKASLQTHYSQLMDKRQDRPDGLKLFDRENAGKINISPVLSPNGRYVIFLSEKDIFTIDLYLADAQSGEIIRQLSSSDKHQHVDAISYMNSSGTWSSDGRKFAFVIFSKGKNKLAIVDIQRNKWITELEIPGINGLSNPVWAPSGNQIAFIGLVDGQSDLFIYDLDGQQLHRLTDDLYSDIQPSWSQDGRKIVFSTDRISFQDDNHGPLKLNLAVIDPATREITNLNVFPGADNLNPLFNGPEEILFLSDRDGFRNLYAYRPTTDSTFQLTNYFTGISGITALSPAMSISWASGKLAFSYYIKNGYEIYLTDLDDLEYTPVDKDSVNFVAATLPPFEFVWPSFVQQKISSLNSYSPLNPDSLITVPYRPKFKLDYIGNTNVGVATSSLGTGLMGGVNARFSDILGNNQMFTGVALNGEIYDFGGQVVYFNQKERIGWGASISHIPYRSGGVRVGQDSIRINPDSILHVTNYALDILRTFEDQVSVFSSLPFSQTRRIEVGGSFSRYSFRVDRFNNYYYSGFKIDEKREKLEAPEGYNLWMANAAFVGDNSYFGVAAPMKGHRFRYELTKFDGAYDFYTVLADSRKYFFLHPLGIAIRLFHYARYGKDINEARISPLFLGFPSLIRGYDDVVFSDRQSDVEGDLGINDLYGNKLLVGNLEFRFPFSGPERLALISSRLFLTELNLFLDAGTSWDPPAFSTREGIDFVKGKRGKFLLSTGVSMRVNLFGQLIMEPYFAIPWQRTDISLGTWGINFTPGW